MIPKIPSPKFVIRFLRMRNKIPQVRKKEEHYGCTKANKRKSFGCPGRLKIRNGVRVVRGKHNHPRSSDGKYEFYRALQDAVEAERTAPKAIYDRISKMERFKDTAVIFPFCKVKINMLRWRRSAKKKTTAIIKTINDYVKYFESPEGEAHLTYDSEKGQKRQLSHKVIEVKNDKGEVIKRHLALFDKKSLEEHQDCKVIQGDATFLTCPNIRGVIQLETFMAKNYNRAWPCIWVLMQGKTAEDYESVLNSIKEEIWPALEPEEFICDFELAFENAVKKVYSDAEVTGCWFHFCQALLRNAISKGAATSQNFKKHPERHLIVRKIMALALLPEEHIAPTFDLIVKDAKKKHGKIFDDFFDYFRDYWLESRGTKRFCVYRKMNRTNNEEESYHHVLKIIFNNRKPRGWQFLDEIMEFQSSLNRDLRTDKETMGTSKSEKKKSTMLKEQGLMDCWNSLEQDPRGFTPLMFVTKAANAFENKYIQLKEIHDDIYDEGPEEEGIELHDLLNTDSDEETGYHYQADTRDNLTSEDQNRKSTVVSNQIDDVQELGHLHTDAEISEQISRFFSDNDDEWEPSENDKDLVPWRCDDPNDLGEVDVMNKAKESVEVYIRPATQSSLCDPPATDEGMIDDELTEACTPENDVATKTTADKVRGLNSRKKKQKRLYQKEEEPKNADVESNSDGAPSNKRQRYLPKKYSDYICN
ncbi:hypothetical protein QAD02_002180 [Eretmocerus hayati]|uniref:Uncharacterized protein n=1 Tax=Eretmocerus hayati TaxID=131215 RepID=A0ACC2NJ25_9HYME|nr:hypothetical protein QAD02_002180 [Eretmocerus hayati]